MTKRPKVVMIFDVEITTQDGKTEVIDVEITQEDIDKLTITEMRDIAIARAIKK
jgi:hypothetical protein